MGMSNESMPWPPLPKTETLLSTAASLAASAILFRSILNDVIPDSVTSYFHTSLQNLTNRFSSQLTVIIEDFDGLVPNHMFQAADIYLGSKLLTKTKRVKAHKPEKEKELLFSIDKNQDLVDVFNGVTLKWILITSHVKEPVTKHQDNKGSRSELRYFELSFHKKHRDMVLKTYLRHIIKQAKVLREEKRPVKLHTIDYNGTDYWGSVNFEHPATFDTVAMDPEKKKEIIEDLNRFRESKEMYARVGKAWKRGYLLYGPPGTGKSSLVAAMANYLKYDVYDLDLKEVQCNSDLRRLLIGTGHRSILVFEDIDRSFEPANGEDEKVSLGGLLNFIDGLWSSCGDERILVFTTNNKDQLDPALLRPGRMDTHIHMSFCTFRAFKTLAANYLQIQDHLLFGEIKLLLQQVHATPAEVAGELIKCRDPQTSLQGLISFLLMKNKQPATQ